MKKPFSIFLFSLCLVSCSFSSFSNPSGSHSSDSPSSGDTYDTDVYGTYYASLSSWKNGEDLKHQLSTIMHNGYTAIAYNWEIVSYASQALDDFTMVDQVYNVNPIAKSDTGSSTNVNGWQREHAFPATLLTGMSTGEAVKNKGIATDYHNLFASFASGNASRGNKNYGVASESVNSDKEGADYRYDTLNFEPDDTDKGMLSRAIFYMATMYEDTLSLCEEYVSYSQSSSSNKKAHGNLSTLLAWSKKEVTRKEYWHNEAVYTYLYQGECQGNRNCFIDYPELVDYCFGDKKNEAGELKNLKPSKLSLSINSDEIHNYAINNDTRREYAIGDTFNQSDIVLYSVANDFSRKTSDVSYTLSGVESGHIFTDSEADKSYKITIKTPKNEITYNIIVKSEVITGASYYVKMETGNGIGEHIASVETTPVSGSKTWGNLSWNVDYGQAKKASKSGNGVSIGTKSQPADTLTMESESLNEINYVALTAHTASGSSASLAISVGNDLLYSKTITYESGVYTLYLCAFSTPKNGKIKITISNIVSAIHLEYIAIDFNS